MLTFFPLPYLITMTFSVYYFLWAKHLLQCTELSATGTFCGVLNFISSLHFTERPCLFIFSPYITMTVSILFLFSFSLSKTPPSVYWALSSTKPELFVGYLSAWSFWLRGHVYLFSTLLWLFCLLSFSKDIKGSKERYLFGQSTTCKQHA